MTTSYWQCVLHCTVDLSSLELQAAEGARMGFNGKQVIHPSQVPVVQKAFTPSDEQLKWAVDLIKAFEEHQASGKVSPRVTMIPSHRAITMTTIIYIIISYSRQYDFIVEMEHTY